VTDVLVLQHAQPEGPAAIGEALARRGIALRTVRIDQGAPVPDSPRGAAGLVVMGGPMGVYEEDRFPHLPGEIRLIRRALEEELPILGVCLGSQLLAAALGARVYPSGRKEIGWHEVRLRGEARSDPLFGGVEERFTPFHWHGDIFDLPRGAAALASSRMTELQAFRSGSQAYGLLFHLEVGGPSVREMVAAFEVELAAAGLPSGPILEGLAIHAASVDRIGRRVFDRWADLVAARG
jgi:GMP synthase (glutamine-hydrolysing)